MSRVQLALNVEGIDQAVAFYATLFDTEPAKRRPGYANFAIAEPPLKLVLLENPGQGGSINHLGVEVASADDVISAAAQRFTAEGLQTRIEDGTTCCYALQDKVWVTGPGGESWEVYTVLADAGAELEGETRATSRACLRPRGQQAVDAAARPRAPTRPPGATSAAPADRKPRLRLRPRSGPQSFTLTPKSARSLRTRRSTSSTMRRTVSRS